MNLGHYPVVSDSSSDLSLSATCAVWPMPEVPQPDAADFEWVFVPQVLLHMRLWVLLSAGKPETSIRELRGIGVQ